MRLSKISYILIGIVLLALLFSGLYYSNYLVQSRDETQIVDTNQDNTADGTVLTVEEGQADTLEEGAGLASAVSLPQSGIGTIGLYQYVVIFIFVVAMMEYLSSKTAASRIGHKYHL
jgi:hypothetical protein